VTFDRRVQLLALGAGLPGAAVALALVWTGDYSQSIQWTVTVVVVASCAGFAAAVRNRVVTTFQTVANLLAALRERDFSIRARRPAGLTNAGDDPFSSVMFEVHELASTLSDQRLGAIEAGALLRTVMEEIDVAVFTFDGAQVLRLVNRAGERLLNRDAVDLLGHTATDLGLSSCLEGQTPRIEQVSFPGAAGRWEVRRTTFRQEGRAHQLLVLADVSRPLRDEERQAWQRLIRVIGHEINNSLTPIKSIAASLESLLTRDGQPDRDDMKRGLAVIGTRADALSRFTTAYARLAKLPEPRFEMLDVGDAVARAAALETRLRVKNAGGPDMRIRADPAQLEQLLINLLRNAADASLEAGGPGHVEAGWARDGRSLVVWVEDDGAGLQNPSNLFVPFFTTKPSGSGIGLPLSRQIAEAHGGTLTLENRQGRPGCRAELRIPF
jgi:two-component system, NtrC family, nitrogen regulation sensor histidine kinase NtrY